MYEYYCNRCKGYIEKIVKNMHEEVKCPVCEKIMKREFPNTMNFKLVYNNKTDMVSWGNEGYARSRYWDDVNRQREKEGKIQTTVTEDIK
jgi:predicted nucleic acid-binding Zn ribbon protein